MAQVQALVPWDREARDKAREAAFPPEEYLDRLRRVRAEMEQSGLTHLVAYSNLADPSAVRWLSGFFTSFGESIVVVPLDRDPMLVTNWVMHNEPMHSGIYMSWLPDTRVCPAAGDDLADEVVAFLKATAPHTRCVGLAGRRFLPSRIAGVLERLDGTVWSDGDAPLLTARRIKSTREVERMRLAARIAGAGLAAAMAACRAGVTEHVVAGVAHGTMFAAGAEALAFDTAVASGALRAGRKHCAPTWRAMADGDMVFLDTGAVIDGYNSDVSRCLAVGEPSCEQTQLLNAAETLFEQVAALGRPGKSVAEWHADAQRIAHDLDFGRHYKTGGFGHGLGCGLFERPNLRFGLTQDVLEVGMVFAFEPMIVVDGLGTGVVEETMLVTPAGLEPLSGLPVRATGR